MELLQDEAAFEGNAPSGQLHHGQGAYVRNLPPAVYLRFSPACGAGNTGEAGSQLMVGNWQE